MSAEQYPMQHEEAEAAAEITLNYEQYIGRPQERKPNGQLVDPLAQTFEQRMNNALDKYMDIARFAAQAVLLEVPEGA